jgi:hypothetical protein
MARPGAPLPWTGVTRRSGSVCTVSFMNSESPHDRQFLHEALEAPNLRLVMRWSTSKRRVRRGSLPVALGIDAPGGLVTVLAPVAGSVEQIGSLKVPVEFGWASIGTRSVGRPTRRAISTRSSIVAESFVARTPRSCVVASSTRRILVPSRCAASAPRRPGLGHSSRVRHSKVADEQPNQSPHVDSDKMRQYRQLGPADACCVAVLPGCSSSR